METGMDEPEATRQISPEIERRAVQKAQERARTARWDIDIAVFLFAILVIMLILLFQEIEIIIVAPIATFGLAMVWLVGWRRGRQLYPRFYDEEIASLEQEAGSTETKKVAKTVEQTIEERVQQALRERWR